MESQNSPDARDDILDNTEQSPALPGYVPGHGSLPAEDTTEDTRSIFQKAFFNPKSPLDGFATL